MSCGKSFPLDYKFIDEQNPQTNKQLGIHIGNAVPVELGVAIGRSILKHVNLREVNDDVK